jgi:hypothetical protein
MSRYEFSFVVTNVELTEEVRTRVGRAVALAGAEALGAELPADAVSAPVWVDEFIRRHWIGIPPVRVVLPEDVGEAPAEAF